MSNPREIENLKTVIERHEKVIEKLEIERTNKIKELKELETLKKELEEIELEKIDEAIAIIPKEILLSYFFKICLSINKISKRKKSLWKMC